MVTYTRDSIELAQVRAQGWALVNTVTNRRGMSASQARSVELVTSFLLTCIYFNDACNSSVYIVSNDRIIS
jgi:hypothetical protein